MSSKEKAMKITESMRLKKGLEMIEEATADGQSIDPELKGEGTRMHKELCRAYEIVHSLRAPKCRKNHQRWWKQIDAAILAEMKRDK